MMDKQEAAQRLLIAVNFAYHLPHLKNKIKDDLKYGITIYTRSFAQEVQKLLQEIVDALDIWLSVDWGKSLVYAVFKLKEFKSSPIPVYEINVPDLSAGAIDFIPQSNLSEKLVFDFFFPNLPELAQWKEAK